MKRKPVRMKKGLKKRSKRFSFGDISLVLGAGLFIVGAIMLLTSLTLWDTSTSEEFINFTLCIYCCLTPLVFFMCLVFGITGLMVDRHKWPSIIGILLAFIFIGLLIASYAEIL